MNKVIIRVLSTFIINKAKRKAFRSKHLNKITPMQEAVNTVIEHMSKLETELNDELRIIKVQLEHTKSQLDNCKNSINDIAKQMPKPFLYKCHFEHEFIKNHFSDLKIDDSKIKNLIKGLDTKSAKLITQILKRTDIVKNAPSLPIDIFNSDEQKELLLLRSPHWQGELTFDDNTFAYQNHILPANHFEVSVFDHQHGLFDIEKDNYNQINGGTIIDVGGFIGDSALVFSQNFPNSNIFSFEASAKNIELFKKTIELNNLKNATIVPYALSDKKETLYINNEQGSAFSTQKEQTNNTSEIEAITLDSWVKENNITNIKLIKVDIEGAEQAFVNGAKETISTQRPILLLSIYHNWNDFLNIKPLIESWNLNYKFKISRPTNGQILLETLLICEPK